MVLVWFFFKLPNVLTEKYISILFFEISRMMYSEKEMCFPSMF